MPCIVKLNLASYSSKMVKIGLVLFYSTKFSVCNHLNSSEEFWKEVSWYSQTWLCNFFFIKICNVWLSIRRCGKWYVWPVCYNRRLYESESEARANPGEASSFQTKFLPVGGLRLSWYLFRTDLTFYTWQCATLETQNSLSCRSLPTRNAKFGLQPLTFCPARNVLHCYVMYLQFHLL